MLWFNFEVSIFQILKVATNHEMSIKLLVIAILAYILLNAR